MIWYHLIFSDNKKAVGYAWNLMGFVAKLAQGVGAFYYHLPAIAYLVTLSPPARSSYVALLALRNAYFSFNTESMQTEAHPD